MDQCNAQTNRTLPSAVSDKGTARLSKPCTTTKEHPPSHTTLRGLDLLKSCAKFYENDLGVATPTVRQSLDAAFNQPKYRGHVTLNGALALSPSRAYFCCFWLAWVSQRLCGEAL